MKYWIAAILLVGALAGIQAVLHNPVSQKSSRPVAKNGVLDLRSTGLQRHRLIPLEGDWLFYPWDSSEFAPPVEVPVPSYWRKEVVGGHKLGPSGIGRYELSVIFPPHFVPPQNKNGKGPPPILGPSQRDGFKKNPGPVTLLLSTPFGTAIRLGVGERQLAQSGTINFQENTSRPGYELITSPFPFAAWHGDTLSVRIDVAGHNHHLSGLYTVPLLGTQTAVDQVSLSWLMQVVFLATLALSLGLFCLGLFFVFDRRRSLLYVSLFCLVVLVRLFVSDAMLIQFLAVGLPWNLVMTLRFLTIPFGVLFTGFYYFEFVSVSLRKRGRLFLKSWVSVVSLLVLLLPVYPKSYVIYLSQFFLIISIIYFFRSLLEEAINGNRKATILAGLGFLTIFFVLQQVFNFYQVEWGKSPQNASLMIITVSMALLALIDIFTFYREKGRLYIQLQNSKHQLKDFADNLEIKVERRTKELAERNKELETLQRFRKRTNAMIIHDLRNPLQVILSGSRREKPNRRPGNQIYAAARRLQMMIQNLLDVDRAEQAKLISRPESLPLQEIVAEAARRQQAFIAEKEISISLLLSDKLRIFADRSLTERTIDNILHNAIKYTPEGGEINFSTEVEFETLKLHCDDSGPGVPEELRTHIFADYASDQFRGDAYGLGLSFVRMAVEAMGGKVTVGESPEGGARFTLVLPNNFHATSTEKIALSEAEMAIISPYFPELRQQRLYAATAVEAMLDEIEGSNMINEWKRQVRAAMYAGDEEAYQALLK